MDWLNTSDSGQGVARPANRYSKAKSLGVDTQAEDTCKEPTQPLTSLLHRILDAVMIRVQGSMFDGLTGQVSLLPEASIGVCPPPADAQSGTPPLVSV